MQDSLEGNMGNGAKQDYIASVWRGWGGVPGALCLVGTSPGRETCVSLLWWRAGNSIGWCWPDAGTVLSETQVLEIRSMMTAGIRATSGWFRWTVCVGMVFRSRSHEGTTRPCAPVYNGYASLSFGWRCLMRVVRAKQGKTAGEVDWMRSEAGPR